MMQELIDDDTFNLWKSKFESTMVYWGTTPMNYSFFAGMFSMEEKGGSHGLSHYIPFKVNNATTTAYHSTQWYTDAGIEALGW